MTHFPDPTDAAYFRTCQRSLSQLGVRIILMGIEDGVARVTVEQVGELAYPLPVGELRDCVAAIFRRLPYTVALEMLPGPVTPRFRAPRWHLDS